MSVGKLADAGATVIFGEKEGKIFMHDNLLFNLIKRNGMWYLKNCEVNSFQTKTIDDDKIMEKYHLVH